MGGVLISAVRIAAEKPTPEPKAQVEATVPAAFAQELQHLGGFTLAQPSQADAVFSLEIPCYGFQLKGMGGRMEPIVSLAGVLKSREGRVLWRNNVITKGDRDGLPYATSGELKRDPEKVRAGLDAASKVAARRLAATLR